MQIALLITCLADNFHPRCGVAIVRVLEHLGHEVCFPAAQTCCGQPMFNDGYRDEARSLARRMVELFRPFPCVVTPSASCAAMVRQHFAGLFDGSPAERAEADSLAGRTYEFVEFLARVAGFDPAEHRVRWEGCVTYHPSCHGRGLGLTDEAQQIMRRIDGLTVRAIPKPEQCCGFGGTFAARYPQLSGSLVADKVQGIAQTEANWVVCNDTGCTMNIAGAARRAGLPARFTTLAEIIAEGLGLLDREAWR